MNIGKYVPEFVQIGSSQNKSKLISQEMFSQERLYFPHIYGMVGTVFNGTIYFCGGGAFPSTCDIYGYLSTSSCKSFNLKEYTLNLLDINIYAGRKNICTINDI